MNEKPENPLDPDDAWFMGYLRRVVRLHIGRRKECERRMLSGLEVAQRIVIWSLVMYAAACGIYLVWQFR
jgi:hypothetical protein